MIIDLIPETCAWCECVCVFICIFFVVSIVICHKLCNWYWYTICRYMLHMQTLGSLCYGSRYQVLLMGPPW